MRPRAARPGRCRGARGSACAGPRCGRAAGRWQAAWRSRGPGGSRTSAVSWDLLSGKGKSTLVLAQGRGNPDRLARMYALPALLPVLLLAAGIAVAQPDKPARVALVIGNGAYRE